MKKGILFFKRVGFFFFFWVRSLGWGAEIVLPMSPLDEITLKQVPFYQEVLWKNCSFDRLDETYLKLTRYVVSEGYGTLTPLILELPDLDWDIKKPFELSLPLPSEIEKDWPKDQKLFLGEHESSRVIALTFKGAYEFEVIAPRLKQLQQLIKERGLVTAGQPRLLLYHYRSFRPNRWRIAELQQPIR